MIVLLARRSFPGWGGSRTRTLPAIAERPRLAYLDQTKVPQFVFGEVDECDTRISVGFQVLKGTLDTVLIDTHPPQKVDQVIFPPQVLTRHGSPRATRTDRGEYNGVTDGTRRLLRCVP